ncbi:MAG: Na/Pi symporter [Candidatus Diapherotrites archaeon]
MTTTGKLPDIMKMVFLALILYMFLVGIKLMGHGFKLFGSEFAEALIQATTNPLVAVSIGLLATTILQSSSTTTALIVGLVAGDALSITTAIYMIMGANVGTSVTNTLASMAHILRKVEFRRAFAGSTVHDFFNVFAILILLPLEMLFHPIAYSATFLAGAFEGIGGFTFVSPLKIIVTPAVEFISEFAMHNPWIIIVFALIMMFTSLYLIVKIMKSLILGKIEKFLDAYLFRTAFTAFVAGLILTSIVQSSSVTTSIVVPLLGAGVLTIRKVFPYTLGANVGTTVTALMAALVTGSVAALTVAFGHLMFNLFGILLIYPFKELPIKAAEKMGEIAYKSRTAAIAYIIFAFYILPLLVIIFLR